MKNILKNSPVLKRVQLDNKFFNTLLSRHRNNMVKLQRDFRFFSSNTFGNVIFLEKYYRRKRITQRKINKYLNVSSSSRMLDLSINFIERKRNQELIELKETPLESATLVPKITRLKPSVPSFTRSLLNPHQFKKIPQKSLNQSIVNTLLEKQKALKIEDKVSSKSKESRERLLDFGFKQLKKNSLESEALAPNETRLKPLFPSSKKLVDESKNDFNYPILNKKVLDSSKTLLKPQHFKKQSKEIVSKSLNQSVVKALLEKKKPLKIEKKLKAQEEQLTDRLKDFGFKQLKKRDLEETNDNINLFVDTNDRKTKSIKKALDVSKTLLTAQKFKKSKDVPYQKELKQLKDDKKTFKKIPLNQSVVTHLLEKQKTLKIEDKASSKSKKSQERLLDFGFKEFNETPLESAILVPNLTRLKPSVPSFTRSLLKPQQFKKLPQKSLNQSVVNTLLEKQKALKIEDKVSSKSKKSQERLLDFGFKEFNEKPLESALVPNLTRLKPSVPSFARSLLKPQQFKKIPQKSLNQSVVNTLLEKQKALKIEDKVSSKSKKSQERLLDFGFKEFNETPLESALVPNLTKLKPSVPSFTRSLLKPQQFKKLPQKSLNQSVVTRLLEKQKALNIEDKVSSKSKESQERLLGFGFKQLKSRESKDSLEKKEDRASLKKEQVKNSQLSHYKKFLFNRQFSKINPLDENLSFESPLYSFEDSQHSSTFFIDFIKRAKKLDSRIVNLENRIFQSQGRISEKPLNSLNNGLSMNLSKPQVPNVVDNIKYAMADRHETTAPFKSIKSTEKNEMASESSTLPDLEELSIKLFQRLKNDIALEYTRAGR